MNSFENFIGFKVNMDSIFNYVKDSIAVIIIIPSLLGGINQLIKLISIAPEMMRFFSVTQVVPDGLAIILYTGIMFGVYYVSTRVLFFFYNFFNSKRESQKYFRTVSIILLVIILGLGKLLVTYLLNTTSNSLKYFNLIIFSISLVAFQPCCLIFYKENYNIILNNKQVTKFIFAITLSMNLFFPPIYNYEYVAPLMKLSYDLEKANDKGFKSSKIRYVNDKYIIVDENIKKSDNNLSFYKIYLLEDVIKDESSN